MADEAHGPTGAAVPPRRPGLLVTRPAPADEELSAWARAAGFVPIPAPVMRLEPLPAAPPIEAAWDGRPDAVVLTSANAARCAPEAPELRAAPCWCVGEATAAAARAAGFADIRAGEGDAAALARRIAAGAPAGARLLHLRGRQGTADLAGALAAAGFAFTQSVVYEMRLETALPEAAIRALNAGEVKVVPAFSPRAARQLARLLDDRFDLRAVAAAAISAAAAAPLRAMGFAALRVAVAPAGPAMREAIRAAARDVSGR